MFSAPDFFHARICETDTRVGSLHGVSVRSESDRFDDFSLQQPLITPIITALLRLIRGLRCAER